jgi:hypothetical protein
VAVAFDAATENVAAADPQNFTHTPSGTPKGVLVYIAHATSQADHVVGVTYGGTAMTRVAFADDGTGELGAGYLYFLGSSIPTGAQTVSIDRNNSTTSIWAVAITVTAANDTEVVDSDNSQQGDTNITNPAVTLQHGGRDCLDFFGGYNGINAPGSMTDAAGQTRIHDHDFGSQAAVVSRKNASDTADTSLSYTAAANSLAMIGVAIGEVVTITNVTGSGSPSVTLSLSGSGTGKEILTGSGSPSVTLSVSASGTGAEKFTGSGAPTVTLSTSASGTGVLEINGNGAPSVTLSVSASGTGTVTNPSTNVTGSGSPSVSLSASASGSGKETFTGSGAPSVSLAVTATGTGSLIITGSGGPSVTLQATGAGTGTHIQNVTGSGAPTVTLSVSASGVAVHDDGTTPAPARRGGGFRRILYDPQGAQEEIDARPEWSPDDIPEARPLPEPGPLPEARITEPTEPVRLPRLQKRVEAIIEDDPDEIDFILNVVLDLD